MKPNDPLQRLAHDGNSSNGSPLDDADADAAAPAPSPASVHAPVSADDVPASVRAAVAEFVPPPGFEDFPTPTKNNLQRSLIYFFGRRVQATATGKSQWFCLASPQCRANKTTISTTANISGCTRHLQVFHQLISPKTAQMSRKASSQQLMRPQQQPLLQHEAPVYSVADLSFGSTAAEPQGVEAHEQLQSDSVDLSVAIDPTAQAAPVDIEVPHPPQHSDRERVLGWTLAVVVKSLLPVAFANDDRLVRLTNPLVQSISSSAAAATASSATEGRALSEKTVRHQLVELYDAAQSILAVKIRKELSLIVLPIFHLALVDVTASATSSSSSSSATSACRHVAGPGDKETFVALQVSFVSSAFTHEKYVLDVRRFPEPKKVVSSPADSSSSSTEQTAMLVWIDRALKRFSIEKKHVFSFVVDRTLSTTTTLLAAAASTFLGRPCELTCVSTCSAALCDAYSSSSGSSAQKLVVALHEFVALSCDADFVDCFRGLESHVDAFVSAALALKNRGDVSLSSLSFPWRAVALILERVARSWDACQVFFLARDEGSGENGSSPSSLGVMPQLLREFTKEDIAQCVSILRPLGDFFGDLEAPESVCAEVIIRMFAIKQTVLNAARPLQVSLGRKSDEHHQVGGEMDEPVNEQVVTVEHAELSQFARNVREELSSHWDASIAEKTSSSLPALTSVFFHPCFRHLSFLDLQPGDAKTLIHDRIKKSARDVLQWKAKLLSASSSSALGNSEDDDGDDQSDSSTPLKKRRLSRQEKLNKQAEELSRLGFLDAFASSSTSSSISSMMVLHPGNGGDQQHQDSSATAVSKDWSAANLMANRELERYLKNESVAFCDVPFDKMLTYWQHKAFDYPTLALVAQAALGHPAVLTQQRHSGSSSCIRCCFGGRGRLPWHAQIRDETQAFEELTLFLHFNEQLINETSPPAELSDAKAALVVATLIAERKRQQQQTPSAQVPTDQSVIQV